MPEADLAFNVHSPQVFCSDKATGGKSLAGSLREKLSRCQEPLRVTKVRRPLRQQCSEKAIPDITQHIFIRKEKKSRWKN